MASATAAGSTSTADGSAVSNSWPGPGNAHRVGWGPDGGGAAGPDPATPMIGDTIVHPATTTAPVRNSRPMTRRLDVRGVVPPDFATLLVTVFIRTSLARNRTSFILSPTVTG